MRTGLSIGPPEDIMMTIEAVGAVELCNVYGATETYGNCAVTDAHDRSIQRGEVSVAAFGVLQSETRGHYSARSMRVSLIGCSGQSRAGPPDKRESPRREAGLLRCKIAIIRLSANPLPGGQRSRGDTPPRPTSVRISQLCARWSAAVHDARPDCGETPIPSANTGCATALDPFQTLVPAY
jgi:hypothetical protein